MLADKNVRKRENTLKNLEDEKDAILARGLNPYVEFRQREVDIESKKKERKIKTIPSNFY